MNWFQIVQFILQIIPMIIKLIREIEAAIPGPGLGAQKLDLLQDLVTTAADAEPGLPSGLNLSGIVSNIAGKVVKSFNAAGVFVKSEDQ